MLYPLPFSLIKVRNSISNALLFVTNRPTGLELKSTGSSETALQRLDFSLTSYMPFEMNVAAAGSPPLKAFSTCVDVFHESIGTKTVLFFTLNLC